MLVVAITYTSRCFPELIVLNVSLLPIMRPSSLYSDYEPLLDGISLCQTSSASTTDLFDLPSPSPSSKRILKQNKYTPEGFRKLLHHHKPTNAYADLPIFENPCPLCLFKHCHKVLKLWLRQ